jgi:asparagine synthase (glutamine-hydrolysing)
MCGIVALVSADRAPEEGAVERATRRLAHRGPDGEGFAKFPTAHLGHRRLAVIDLVTGTQPMFDGARRRCIVFNGEIYNYRELRRELDSQGHAFATSSDTEVVLAAVAAWGAKEPQHLRGMFAFAVWDTVEKTLTCARDPFGEKPLYTVVCDDGTFAVASELPALLAAGGFRPELDREAVDLYLNLLYVPPDRTIFRNVSVLSPGHVLVWSSGRVTTTRYFTPKLSTEAIADPRDAAREVRARIEHAVESQRVADVPLGAFLSGGLDSTTIVACLAGRSHRPVTTFSVGFRDFVDELPFANEVAERYRTDHHAVQAETNVGEILDTLVDVYGEPFADSSSVPTWQICGYACRFVTVALSGDGGDEIFGGYGTYAMLLDDARLTAKDRSFASLVVARIAAKALMAAGVRTPWAEEANRNFRRARSIRAFPDPWDRHVAASTSEGDETAALWERPPGGGVARTLRASFGPADASGPLDAATAFDLSCYLPGDILVKVDRAAMAHGLETRAPFLDVALAEYVLSLPASLRFADGELKYLLRRACSDLWTESVKRRGKQGFGGPVAGWLARPDVASRFAHVLRSGGPLTALLPGLRHGRPKNRRLQWAVLQLGLWLDRHPELL